MHSHIKKKINLRADRPFILIGNNINGNVNVNFECFTHWDEVCRKLPGVIAQLRYEGEWNLILYQVPNLQVEIRTLFGHYHVPKGGKKVMELSYLDFIDGKRDFIIDEDQIHFSATSYEGNIFSKTYSLTLEEYN